MPAGVPPSRKQAAYRPAFGKQQIDGLVQMTKQTKDTADSEMVAVEIPKVLYDRVEVYCNDRNITPYEFFMDAIGEKLQRSYSEKRKRPRL